MNNLRSRYARIRYLVESVPEIRNRDNPKRKLLLTLLYWKVFDGIEISPEIMQQIIAKGTYPETIYRALRRLQ